MRTAAKLWQLHPYDEAAARQLAEALRVPHVVAQLLLNRGLADPNAAKRFLEAPLTGLHPPSDLPGAAAAADRLAAASRDGRRICIYGDYDVDGVTGTAILAQTLARLGAKVETYVPHRLEEGYGLNCEALRRLAGSGIRVVVTVDCGITSCEEADEARRLGLELIVTDHHEFKAELPRADVLVHPRLPGGSYPFGGLSGAGVAFKLAWLVSQKVAGSDKLPPKLRDGLLDAVALAALGLVADVVPLFDENRIFVRHGLRRLHAAPTVGLRALLEVAKLGEAAAIRAEDVSFKLAPRLNAAGRLGLASMVVELLTTPVPQRARDLALYLEEQNSQRQKLERQIVTQARAMLSEATHAGAAALVLASPEWHPGVIGIVAGRLVDLFGRPALVIAVRGEVAPGSGRSVPGFPLHEALAACSDHLIGHGGHAMAAGFRVAPDRIDGFRLRFCEYAAAHFPDGPQAPRLMLDAEVPLAALTPGLLRDLDRLEPYGAQNPRPRLLAGDLQIVGEPRRIGGGERHLSFRVKQSSASLRAIAFGMGDRVEELMSAGGRCCLAFTPRMNEWNGYRSVELEVIDLQSGAQARLG